MKPKHSPRMSKAKLKNRTRSNRGAKAIAFQARITWLINRWSLRF